MGGGRFCQAELTPALWGRMPGTSYDSDARNITLTARNN